MADVMYLSLIAGFFALAAAFVKACEAIIGPDERSAPAPVEDTEEPMAA